MRSCKQMAWAAGAAYVWKRGWVPKELVNILITNRKRISLAPQRAEDLVYVAYNCTEIWGAREIRLMRMCSFCLPRESDLCSIGPTGQSCTCVVAHV